MNVSFPASIIASAMLGAALYPSSLEAAEACDLRQAQAALKVLGQDPGPIDGLWGARTRSAVLEFQAKQSVEESGLLNEVTCEALGLEGRAIEFDEPEPLSAEEAAAKTETENTNFVVWRSWCGEKRSSAKCELGESAFIAGRFIPCGFTFKNSRNQIGGGKLFRGAQPGPEKACKSLDENCSYYEGYRLKKGCLSALELAKDDEKKCRAELVKHCR